ASGRMPAAAGVLAVAFAFAFGTPFSAVFADSSPSPGSPPSSVTADAGPQAASVPLTPGAATILKSGAATAAALPGPPPLTTPTVTAGAVVPVPGTAVAPGKPSDTIAAATIPHPSGPAEAALTTQVHAVIDRILPADPAARLLYENAAAKFPSFCEDWARLLHEREIDNLGHLTWQERGGYQTATYTGYGKIESCECKDSEGVPIGKVRYEEMNYYLAGKTIDDAKRSAPKLLGVVNTLEIFSWEKSKWFY
ncbi:MAG TPA: hypothetical protein VJN94_11785, partial [Candidatus Binataceae bacterium]|nr:hypothetical protein [Candidatus Binataceae bacterium]